MPVTQTAASNSRVTRCPDCQTTFRVNDSQLQAAAGMVRCGTCMHVFNAHLHWLEAPPVKAHATLGGVALLRQEAEIDPAWQAPPAAEPPLEPPPAPEDDFEFSDSFLALGGASSFPLADSDDKPTAEASEEWARALLEQEESTPPAHRKEILDTIAAVAHGRQPGGTIAARRQHALSSNVPEKQQLEADEVHGAEKWMQTLLGGGEPAAHPEPAAGTRKPAPVTPAASEPTDEYIPEIFRKPKPAETPQQPVAIAPTARRAPRRPGLWLAGISATALLLLAQYSWFNADRLAANPSLRHAIAQFCALTRCHLPTQQDLGRIDNSNLMVFKHPTTPGVLILDTILTNQADFAQPYPRLKVTFSNFQDQLVAQYQFLPREYLGDDIASDTLMPPTQPVRLSLELADPGEQAVNYKIELLPAR